MGCDVRRKRRKAIGETMSHETNYNRQNLAFHEKKAKSE